MKERNAPPPSGQDVPEGCLPFDLEKAKQGHPLITRNLRRADFVRIIDGDVGAPHRRVRECVS